MRVMLVLLGAAGFFLLPWGRTRSGLVSGILGALFAFFKAGITHGDRLYRGQKQQEKATGRR